MNKIFPTGNINEEIYNYLWKCPKEIAENLKLNIPDTVLFSNNVPTEWIFTNKEGFLKKKVNKSKEEILHRFLMGEK